MISTTTIEPQIPIGERFISTQVEQKNLVFPAEWVREILRLQRSQILDLPFYDPMLVGITHHNGNVLPLISGHRLLKMSQFALREMSTVVRLNDRAGNLANIGVVVDRAIGSSQRSDLPPTLFDRLGTSISDLDTILLDPDLLPSQQLWQPQKWG
jgi:chemotaxis signal transduction protein